MQGGDSVSWDYLGDYCACQVIRQGGKEGWRHANERKGIDYLTSRDSTSIVCFLGGGSFRLVRSAGGYQRGEAVRRGHRRVLEGRGVVLIS